MARPTGYRPDFHIPEFLRLSKQGKTVSQIALEWDVHRATLYNWAKTDPKFLDTLQKGKEFVEGWYTDIGYRAMLGQLVINGQKVKLDLGLYVWLTKNLLKWSDKIETKNEHEVESEVTYKTQWQDQNSTAVPTARRTAKSSSD